MQLDSDRPPLNTAVLISNRRTKQFLAGGIKPTLLAQQAISTLWLLKQATEEYCEVILFETCEYLAYSENSLTLKLDKNKDRRHQLWLIVEAQSVVGDKYYWLRPAEESSLLRASSYSTNVQLSPMDRTLEITLWKIELGGGLLKSSCVIRSAVSKLVLAVPENALKNGGAVIQQSYSGAGNQRWWCQDCNGVLCIRNVSSRRVLTVLRNKVCESLWEDKAQQLWTVVQRSNEEGKKKKEEEEGVAILKKEEVTKKESHCLLRTLSGLWLQEANKEFGAVSLSVEGSEWIIETD